MIKVTKLEMLVECAKKVLEEKQIGLFVSPLGSMIMIDQKRYESRLKEAKEEGFDDGKDLARLLIQNTTKGLRPEEHKRLKELKLKYSIPSYE